MANTQTNCINNMKLTMIQLTRIGAMLEGDIREVLLINMSTYTVIFSLDNFSSQTLETMIMTLHEDECRMSNYLDTMSSVDVATFAKKLEVILNTSKDILNVTTAFSLDIKSPNIT
ncbi:hypothetical protein O6H91_Y419100 [Diphasiastrum complanatum]|nr:hypothetical protein O6H91_Y419100 [Diphasiastrum complanatum]